MIGNDLKKFCQSISTNPYLRVLNMGMNKLGDSGVQYLANALKVNIGLHFVDLFDVEFGDDGAMALAEALLLNKTLINLRLANTRVKPSGSTPLIK
jgi:Ran GTPase-activating protein (RanGAP) involved in mRNA processing and transport